MKAYMAAVAALAIAAQGTASAKSPLEGLWERGSMQVRIAPCGSKLCGTVVKASESKREDARRGSGIELIGSRLLSDIEPTGPASYRGRVWVFDRDVQADGTIRQLGPDTVVVKGCLLLVICKTKTWSRVG